MIPICVFTSNHPKYDLIDRIKRKKLYINNPVYYFIYDKDWELYNFDIYKDYFKEIHYVKVPYLKFKSDSELRYFIQNYMFNFNKFWIIDNNIGLSFEYKDIGTKKLKTISIFKVLEDLEKNFKTEFNSYGLIGFLNDWHDLLKDMNNDISEGYASNILLINNELLKNNFISYTGDPNVDSEIELMILCRIHNVKVGRFNKYKYTSLYKNKIENKDIKNIGYKRTFKKYKYTNIVKTKINKKGYLRLQILKKPEVKQDLWS